VLIEGVCDDECFRTYLGMQWLFQAAITNTNKCKIYIEILAIKNKCSNLILLTSSFIISVFLLLLLMLFDKYRKIKGLP